MIVKMHASVVEGDFIRPWGHNVSREQKWWKVEHIDGDMLYCRDRYGYRRGFEWRQGRKWATWQPGDSRRDGDVL